MSMDAPPPLTPVVTPELRSAVATGLSTEEAEKRLAAIGPNAVAEVPAHPIRKMGLRFLEPVPLMLEAAIALQLAIGERIEAIMIAALLLFNVALSIHQERSRRCGAGGAQDPTCPSRPGEARRQLVESAGRRTRARRRRPSARSFPPTSGSSREANLSISRCSQARLWRPSSDPARSLMPAAWCGVAVPPASPAALPATFSLAAALGAQRLVRKGVLLTRLTAVHEAATMERRAQYSDR